MQDRHWGWFDVTAAEQEPADRAVDARADRRHQFAALLYFQAQRCAIEHRHDHSLQELTCVDVTVPISRGESEFEPVASGDERRTRAVVLELQLPGER